MVKVELALEELVAAFKWWCGEADTLTLHLALVGNDVRRSSCTLNRHGHRGAHCKGILPISCLNYCALY